VRHSFDVLVAGGGPAGCAAALDLSYRGFRVALIEQGTYESPRIGETLPPVIRQQLTALGVWERFLECGPLESYGIQTAWETTAPRYQDFLRNPYGCGWHVDRARFDSILAHAAVRAGAELIMPARVTNCQRRSDGVWQVDTARGEAVLKLTGRMLLDATGRKGLLATKLGSQAHVTDRLIGAVPFSDVRDTAQQTLIEAVQHGWWYSAPIPGARIVITYMTDSDLWRNSDWSDLLKHAPLTSARAGSLPIPPPLQIVSAVSVVRCPVTGPDWMAIGDAALAYDPLSGQGVLNSIETGTRSSATTARYLGGDPTALAEYEAWLHDTYQSYLSYRSQLYRSVLRWPKSEFWKRRATAITG
jgi:flavin-dependent dehydrogenase